MAMPECQCGAFVTKDWMRVYQPDDREMALFCPQCHRERGVDVLAPVTGGGD